MGTHIVPNSGAAPGAFQLKNNKKPAMRAHFCPAMCARFGPANWTAWGQFFEQCWARFWYGLASDVEPTLGLVWVPGWWPYIVIADTPSPGDDTDASLYHRTPPMMAPKPRQRSFWTKIWAMPGRLP